MVITEEEIEQANQRGLALRASCSTVVSVRYDRRVSQIIVTLASGQEISFSPKHVQGLENGRPEDFANTEIRPSGLGIHFPDLDADIYLPGLLAGFLGSKSWMADQNGKLGYITVQPEKQEP